MASYGNGAYVWIIALLLILGGFAWLTQNPEAEIVEKAQDWPLLGSLAAAFRQAYLPPDPVPLEVPEEPEVEEFVPPAVDSADPRYVWVQAGASLHEKPDESSPVVNRASVIRNLSIITQRGDWYRVWVPRQGARPVQAWVLLRDYQEPTREDLYEADRVVPLAATPPDLTRIASARQLMQGGGTQLGCGRQALWTDSPDDEMVGLCEQLIANLETVYRERYGLQPVSPPAEAILLFAQAADYRRFRDLEEIPFDTGLAHASPARGYVAVFRGDRRTDEVLATLVHESTHLLNRRSLGPALPPWLNEGIADDLAESRIDSSAVITPDVLGGETYVEDGRTFRSGGQAAAIELQAAIHAGTLPTLRELAAMEEGPFYAARRVQLHYALSSFWVRYLASGFDPDLTRGFRLFLRDIANGEPLESGLLQERLGVDWDSLEQQFRIWVHLQFVRPPNEEPEASSQRFFLSPSDAPVGVVFLLPDGDLSLEALEHRTAGLIGGRTMG